MSPAASWWIRKKKTMQSAQTDVMARLGRDLSVARRLRHMTVSQCAHAIGIAPATLRRIEQGKSRNARGETLLLILAWACSRGYRQFAGFSIEPAKPREAAQ
jgi:transcriptional regulator with XRE-family HTH domain